MTMGDSEEAEDAEETEEPEDVSVSPLPVRAPVSVEGMMTEAPDAEDAGEESVSPLPASAPVSVEGTMSEASDDREEAEDAEDAEETSSFAEATEDKEELSVELALNEDEAVDEELSMVEPEEDSGSCDSLPFPSSLVLCPLSSRCLCIFPCSRSRRSFVSEGVEVAEEVEEETEETSFSDELAEGRDETSLAELSTADDCSKALLDANDGDKSISSPSPVASSCAPDGASASALRAMADESEDKEESEEVEMSEAAAATDDDSSLSPTSEAIFRFCGTVKITRTVARTARMSSRCERETVCFFFRGRDRVLASRRAKRGFLCMFAITV